MSPLKDLRTIPALILIALWIAAALPALQAEYVALKAAPELARLSYEEKAPLVSGPIYDLTQKAASFAPQGATVHFINPSEDSQTGFFAGKARYYLYPREVVVSPGSSFDPVLVKGGDYIMVYAPASFNPAEMDATLKRLFSLEVLHYEMDERGLRAVYMVGGGA